MSITIRLAAAAAVLALSPLLGAAERDLAAELDALRAELAALQQDTVQRVPGGGLRLGDTTLRLGGYVRADMSVSNHGYQNGTNNEVVVASGVKATRHDRGWRTGFSARQSQLYLSTVTPFGEQALRTHVAVDFYGNDMQANELVSNSYAPRLREAYGSYGGWLVGQTWSTFTDLQGVGDLLAFGQHASVNFVRQAQVRYTRGRDVAKLELALENPEDTGLDHQDVPDTVVRLSTRQAWGYLSAAAVARRLRLDDASGRDAQWTGAYSVTGRFPTWGKDDLRLQLNYGNLGRYMGLRTFADAVVDQGQISDVTAWGYSVIYRHYWTERLRSSAAWSDSGLRDQQDYQPGTNRRYRTASVNLLWSPLSVLTYGIELQHYQLQEVGGRRADLARVQLAAQYSF